MTDSILDLEQLDERYGVSMVPPTDRISDEERRRHPISKVHLASGSFFIESIMGKPIINSPISSLLFSEIRILWIVDREGNIILSLEEIIDTKTENRYPRPNRAAVPDSYVRIGHPALVGGGEGRIGGEIYLDTGFDGDPKWVINNDSGRYGKFATRTKKHLQNVAEVFKNCGIALEIQFIPS